jgi:hypothetical protein
MYKITQTDNIKNNIETDFSGPSLITAYMLRSVFSNMFCTAPLVLLDSLNFATDL